MGAEGGFWLAYHSDLSGLAAFDSEIECLRYAVEHSMAAMFVKYGEDLRQQVNRA